jgi:hypothetical protein
LRPFRERKRQSEVNIGEVEIRGDQIVREQLDQGCGVLIMPNHASHADPYVIYAGADKVGTALHVMATWHVFHDQPRLIQWALRKHGCFSVDREGNDIGAFRIATKILQEKREPLVLFPEGEIYHCNDRVTPFREGAAAIAITAARKGKRSIVCIPCAMTYRYVDDPTAAMLETMGQLEEAIFWRRRNDRPLNERIYGFAEALLVVKELEYYGETHSGRLPDRIRALEDHILQQVESRHEISGAGKSLPERVKAARKTIIEKISDRQIAASEKQSLEQDLEDLFIVVQSFSYPGDYVNDKPSIERMAETLDKFEEDVLQKVTASIKGERRAIVQFGEPLEVIGDRKVKNQTTDITTTIEQRVQSMLDHVA